MEIHIFFLYMFVDFLYLFFSPTAKSTEIAPKINYSRNMHYPTKHPNLFQGDILMSAHEIEARKSSSEIPYGNAVTDPTMLWPNGIIYYSISRQTLGEHHCNMIRKAMDHLESETCVRFYDADQYGSPYNHILDISNSQTDGEVGCYSWIGYVPVQNGTRPGFQTINLDPRGCFDHIGVPEHELMHALGLDHEQNRPDRDRYIKIMWENIEWENWNQFSLFRQSTTFGQPYDYSSAMQYANDAFSKRRGEATMVAKHNPQICLGTRLIASQCDLEKIRKLYNCPVKNNCVVKERFAEGGRCDHLL